jgi:cell division protein ZapA (FtsZ GTPase activity inhibitor)
MVHHNAFNIANIRVKIMKSNSGPFTTEKVFSIISLNLMDCVSVTTRRKKCKDPLATNVCV